MLITVICRQLYLFAPASWKTRSKNPSENASGKSFSARTCYVLHGMLVLIHVFLTMSYISRWEHRVTLPFTPTNTDFWPVVLSASLQAFYTLYTVVLVFLTQRLAMSRTLVRRLKLTSIHDISGAWGGLGSALSSVWKQIGVPASSWATTAVTTYLICISVLHVTSSTLLQFQTFNSFMTTNVSTTLGWVDPSNFTLDWVVENWEVVTASLPAISQFPGLISIGLSNNTVYDTSRTNSIVGYATVNATTMTSSCGLLPNVTYSLNQSTASAPFGNGNVLLMTLGNLRYRHLRYLRCLRETRCLWEIRVHRTLRVCMACSECSHDNKPSANSNTSIEVYFVQCSLLTNNITVVIDMQTNALQNPIPISQPSTQWGEMHQWTSTPWSIFTLPSPPSYNASTTVFYSRYIMSLVGLNLTAQYDQWAAGEEPPVSNFTLRLDKLEAAIAQTVAEVTWISTRMGSNGGVPPGEGMALVDEEVIALRLNLLFATSASVIMLGLALHMTGAFDASHNSQAAIQNTGALQLLWLGHHSPSVHEALEDVEHPTEDNLRRAGMIDVCFARTTSDEEELPTRSSTDSPSVQGVDHGRENGM
ncbi:hypothetical protein DEU56DRAFT_747020 [Suillus clintonianus]|uniref:uncharacterized protein n=1 Tax=Suillus clintonianus TaxID=1904413 RepID=UPI001B8687F1|nr:uncharacterized protein DEU56DRAFT_747020 [Suillus clintonianus]KAG2120226.1 hypothetical protein DEU56DRAFT_747020 [Suillus clintonianus]